MKLKNLFYISVVVFVLFLTGCSNSSAADKKELKVNNERYDELIDEFVGKFNWIKSDVIESQVYNIEEIDGVKNSSILIHVKGDMMDERYDFPASDWYGIYVLNKEEWYEGNELTATDRVEEMVKTSELLYEKEY